MSKAPTALDALTDRMFEHKLPAKPKSKQKSGGGSSEKVADSIPKDCYSRR